jgi:hypothetical protein
MRGETELDDVDDNPGLQGREVGGRERAGRCHRWDERV